ncbi:unnamed protein product [Symbiodinium sp. CCMP2456]|nr:unnamed protein product [Symbiodinium sp. CCMP2456]
MAGVPHLPERAHFGKAPAEPEDQPLFVIHGVDTGPGSTQAAAEDLHVPTHAEHSPPVSPSNRVLARGRTRRLSQQDILHDLDPDLQISASTSFSLGNPRARNAGKGLLRQATVRRLQHETEAEVRSPEHSTDLMDFCFDGRQHPRIGRPNLSRQATFSRQHQRGEDDLSIGSTPSTPSTAKPAFVRRQVTGLRGVHAQEDIQSPEGSLSVSNAAPRGVKRRALHWGRQVTRANMVGEEQAGPARVLSFRDGSPRSQKNTREEYIIDIPDVLEPSDSMILTSRSISSSGRPKGSYSLALELDELETLPGPGRDVSMDSDGDEPEPASTERRVAAKAKGKKLGKPRLQSQRRTPGFAAVDNGTDSTAQGSTGQSGEDGRSMPKRKQRKGSASGTSARGKSKGSKPASAKRSPSREKETSQATQPDPNKPLANSRSASRSLSNLSDTDGKTRSSKQRTSSVEFEKTASGGSASASPRRRSLSREASGSSAGSRRVTTGNLSASSTREFSRSGSAAASPTGGQTPKDKRGLRSGRMTPKRREERRQKLRRRLAKASLQVPRRKDGKVSFLRKAWSQARSALLGLPEPETQDDNDPKAKGLRGWNAARALCIGTGRALQDSKRIMTIVRQAADEAYHRHCLQKAIIEEIGGILRRSLANVSDDMDETIGDILMDLQRLKMMDMTEVGALVCEAILNFDDGEEEPESGSADATEAASTAIARGGDALSALSVKRPTTLQSLRDELWQHVHSMPNREDVTGMEDDEIEMQLDRIVDQVDDLRKQLIEATRLSVGRQDIKHSSLRGRSDSRLSGIGVVDMPSDGRESVESILSRLSGVGARSRAASSRASSSGSESPSRPERSPRDKPQLSSGWRSAQKLWGQGSLTARADEASEPCHPASMAPDGFGSVMSAETVPSNDPFQNTGQDQAQRLPVAEESRQVDRQLLIQRLKRQDTAETDDSEGLLGRSWGSTWSPPAKPPRLKVRGRSPGHSPSRERLRPAQVTPVPVAPGLVEVSQRSVLYAAMTAFPQMQKATAVVRTRKGPAASVKEVSADGAVLPSLFLPRPLSPNARRQGGG